MFEMLRSEDPKLEARRAQDRVKQYLRSIWACDAQGAANTFSAETVVGGMGPEMVAEALVSLQKQIDELTEQLAVNSNTQ